LVSAVERAGYGARVHEAARDAEDEVKDYRRRLAVSAFLSFDVLVFSLVTAPGTRAAIIAAWVFATPVQFYGGWPFLRAAARAARHGTYTMDTLVACGSLAAYGYSVGATLRGGHHPYFDTSAMIVTFILLGKVLEATARAKAGDAARMLLDRQPRTAMLAGSGEERSVPIDELAVGDVVVVRPGGLFPADGRVRSGRSSVDLSLLTGESMPEDVGPGDDVVGGSLNVQGRLELELTAVGADTRLAHTVRLLETTQASRAPIQRLADRVSAVFVPRILLISVVVLFAHWLLGSDGFGAALLHAAAVLLVACPCSLGLATPAAVMAGSGRAAELGILFKGGEVFEAARRIDTVLIDKTGTLTDGSMRVTTIVPAGITEDELLSLAAAAESGSEHPIAVAVTRAARERGVTVPGSEGHRAEPGAGITALVGGETIRMGRPDDLPPGLAATADDLSRRGLTVFAVWRDQVPIGLLGAFDPFKAEAAEAVARLRRTGMQIAVISGDRRPTVEAAAREAGIDVAVAEVFPEGKIEEVAARQASGRKVAFVGDGLNDAPALAQADLGIALGTGTDVAMEAGDVLIVGGDLRQVAAGLNLARRTFWVITQNLAWAFAYNALMIPLAVAGKVSPLVAAAAMAGSSVTVVANSLRLRRFGRRLPLSGSSQPLPLPSAMSAREQVPPQIANRASGFPADRPGDDQIGAKTPNVHGPGSGGRRPEEPAAAPRSSTFARQEARRVLHALSRLYEQQWEA